MVVGLLQQKKFGEAVETARSLVTKDPENSIYYNLLAVAQFKSGDVDAARGSYLKSMELDPGYVTPAINLASIEIDAGELEKARSIYDKLLLAKPLNLMTLNAKAVLMIRVGDTDRAVDLWQTAQMNYPADIQSDRKSVV